MNGAFISIEKSRVINNDRHIHYSIFYVTPTIRLFDDRSPSLPDLCVRACVCVCDSFWVEEVRDERLVESYLAVKQHSKQIAFYVCDRSLFLEFLIINTRY